MTERSNGNVGTPPEPISVPGQRRQPTEADRWRLIAVIGAFVVFVVLWQTGNLDGLLYPLRLLVSLIHEMGHGLTAILTGGHFDHFEVFANGAGLAYTYGGSAFLVPQMGYMGAALFGAVLLTLTNRVRDVRPIAYGVAALIGGCALFFTAKGGLVLLLAVGALLAWGAAAAVYRTRAFFQIAAIGLAVVTIVVTWGEVTLRIGLISALVIAALGAFAPRPVTIFVLNFLALVVGLNAILDIAYLLQAPGASVGSVPNDAAAMTRLTGLPVVFWALLWVGLALLMNGLAFYVSFIAPARRRIRRPAEAVTRSINAS